MFREEVTTGAGVVKKISANTEKELAEAVKAAAGESAFVYPDINNVEHANAVVEVFTKSLPEQTLEVATEEVVEAPKKKLFKRVRVKKG